MLSAHQIFKDFKENTELSTIKDTRSNTNGKLKSLGLKNSTNTGHDKRAMSDSCFETKKPTGTFKKSVTKEESQTVTIQVPGIPESSENWPEVENMHIYNEPEDDYEDILPKSERITKAEIECLFLTGPIGRLVELTVDQLPTISFEAVDDFDHDSCLLSYITDDDLLYDDTPIGIIPLPDNPFLDESV